MDGEPNEPRRPGPPPPPLKEEMDGRPRAGRRRLSSAPGVVGSRESAEVWLVERDESEFVGWSVKLGCGLIGGGGAGPRRPTEP